MPVLLILVDGMRPDAIADLPQVRRLMERSRHTLSARTVWPSVTLPCHMSLFHSVDPDRHGTTTNIYAPQVRPIEGLCEVLKKYDKTSAFFYSWEQLRDVTRPGSLQESHCRAATYETYPAVVRANVEDTLAHLQSENPADLIFCYLGWPDEAGHQTGWMSETYLDSLRVCWDYIEELLSAADRLGYTTIVTADHGGHDRIHGETVEEDMTIPLFLTGPGVEPAELDNVSIKDIAPTVAALLEAKPAKEWEGKALL